MSGPSCWLTRGVEHELVENVAQVYRVIRVILESSLESEILRTLRTPSLSDNETLKTLRVL